ncbi:MAG: hypothetical protein Tsb0020_01530 [Haliangiales bacterium]
MKHISLAIALTIAVAACGDDNGSANRPDANPPVSMPDAAAADAAAADAAIADAAPPDAALPDAEPPDAGPPPQIFAYWANFGGTIGRVDVDDNTQAGDIVTGLTTPFRVAVDPDNEKIYYGGGTARITQADLDGQNPVPVIETGETPFGLTVDTVNDKLYWSEFNSGRILRSDLDGSNAEVVIGTGLNAPSGIWIDTQNENIYVISSNNTQIQRANMDGTGLETVAPDLGGQGIDVLVDPVTPRILYSRAGADISVMDLDGSNQAVFVGDQSDVHGMAVDVVAGKLYWAAGGVIRRADLADGGNVEDVHNAAASLWGISLLPTPAP